METNKSCLLYFQDVLVLIYKFGQDFLDKQQYLHRVSLKSLHIFLTDLYFLDHGLELGLGDPSQVAIRRGQQSRGKSKQVDR